MREKLSADIAVIGMACRFPGARTPDQYWDNLAAGRVSIGEAPAARWRWQDYPGASLAEESYCRWGGFIDDVDAFDASFFDISPREAESMDPQQRLGLELAWSCLEDAGIRPSRLAGENVGVFIGVTNLDYKELMEQAPIDVYYATSTLSSVIPNRISHQLNLRGPSLAIDTACSSSLNAIHLACRALQANECEIALAGGISLLLTSNRFIWYGKAGILSPTGTLRTFDEGADGTVRGEGAGLILLKPLARAIADGDRVIGVVKGSAVNHGGRSYTLTYPSPTAQASVIVSALRAAGVVPSAVSYVEAHGTGTIKGDPIEVQGLVNAFQADGVGIEREQGPWCGLGSVKPNIGHLEGAAGVAGVIKVLQALRHKGIPPLTNFASMNARIGLGETFYFADKLLPWVSDARPRIAGVSSFGFAGTNAHVVVAEAPVADQDCSISCAAQRPSVVVLSAKSFEQLKEQASLLGHAIAAQGLSDSDLEGIAYTLQVGREAMSHRVAITVETIAELTAKLNQFVQGHKGIEGLCSGEVKASEGRPETDRSKVAENWVKGVEVDWEQLYGGLKPRRLSLPTYPFARQRYWISRSPEIARDSTEHTRLHPLIHQNTSDLGEQRFSTVLTGQESFLAGHQIRGQRVLPAAAYLEMIREAVTRSLVRQAEDRLSRPIDLSNLVWLRPLVVGTEPVTAHIGLVTNDRGGIGFEVYSGFAGDKVVHAYGVAVVGPACNPPSLDIEALENQYSKSSYSSESCYAAFKVLGIDYRHGHCGIDGLHVEGNEVVARLSLPVSKSSDQFVLHPGAVDSGLQAIIGFALAADAIKSGSRPFVPFDLQSAEIYGRSSPRMWAVVRRDAAASGVDRGRYDIDLSDEAGQVFLRLLGLTTRVMGSNPEVFRQAPYPVHATQSGGGEGRSSRGRESRFGSVTSDGVSREELGLSTSYIGMDTMWSRVRRKNKDYDIDLSDEYGRVRVHLRDWIARPLHEDNQGPLSFEPRDSGEVILSPVWEAIPFAYDSPYPAPATGSMVVVGGTSDQRLAVQRLHVDFKYFEANAHDTTEALYTKILKLGEIGHLVWIVSPQPDVLAADSIIAGQRGGVFLGFRLIKAMLAAGHGDRAIRWTILTTAIESVAVGECVQPTHASVRGLMGSAANEYPAWDMRLIDLSPAGEAPWKEIFTMRAAQRGAALAYRTGRWYRQCLLPYRLLADPPLISSADQVYVMIGGHGGIGAAWSEVLLRRSRVQLVWIGRRPMNEMLRSQIDKLAELGPPPMYISADATDRQQLEEARSAILQKFGRIDGLVHAAMVLKDQSLANMTEDAFGEALRSKVDVCVRLAQVFAQDALHFVLFFSSWNAFIKSAGQSNYVAGCTFEDSFARRMAVEWPCRVRVINWGYWGTIGYATAEHYQTHMARKGLGSIELQRASRILDELLGGSVQQIAYLEATGRDALRGHPVLSDEWTTSFREVLPSCISLMDRNSSTAPAGSALPSWCAQAQELDKALADLLWFQLDSMGLLIREMDLDEAAHANLELRARYGRWLESSIALLRARGYRVSIEQPPDSSAMDGAYAWERWERARGQWFENSEWVHSAQLVETMLRALPDILIGRRTAAEILSAYSLVDFSGPLARFCGETIAQAVVRYMEQRRQIDPHCKLRILEITSGTGAPSLLSYPAMSASADCLQEYALAGVSVSPLQDRAGFSDLGPDCLTYQTFDVDIAPEAQGIALDSYDLVIANNVLHSAKDVTKALRNVKAVLKTNGLLMMQELTANTMLNHLTAGLLDGCWGFEDAELRIPGGPALSPTTWEMMLQQEEFRSTLYPVRNLHDYGNLVAMAESNGVIRQALTSPELLQYRNLKSEAEQQKTPQKHATNEESSVTVDEIMSFPRAVAMEHFLSRLQLRVAETLGVDAMTLATEARPFADMLLTEVGMDSLSSSDLRLGLRQEFGIDLPVYRILAEKVDSIVESLYDELLIRHVGQNGMVDSDDRETYVF